MKIFCSASCISKKWESDYGQRYAISISTIETLSPQAKSSLFRRHMTGVNEVKDAKMLIGRLQDIDQRIGYRFFVRTELMQDTIPRLAKLSLLPRLRASKAQNLLVISTKVGQITNRLEQLKNHLGSPSIREHLTPVQNAHSSNEHVSYIAVSYCWHSSEWDVVSTIRDTSNQIQEYQTPISSKMLDAVSMLRRDENEAIWVDQLCIKQSESEEKQSAIATMDIIYQMARLVAIVIEDISLSRDELLVWRRLREKS
jgi:Heterokaryon incompatibility protein (HET)